MSPNAWVSIARALGLPEPPAATRLDALRAIERTPLTGGTLLDRFNDSAIGRAAAYDAIAHLVDTYGLESVGRWVAKAGQRVGRQVRVILDAQEAQPNDRTPIDPGV